MRIYRQRPTWGADGKPGPETFEAMDIPMHCNVIGFRTAPGPHSIQLSPEEVYDALCNGSLDRVKRTLRNLILTKRPA